MIQQNLLRAAPLRGLCALLPAVIALGCEPTQEPGAGGGTRGRRAAAAAASGQPTGDAKTPDATPAAAEAPPTPTAPPDEDPEALAEAYAMDPPGTRAPNIRCQAASAEHNLRFMSAWYTYTDRDSPGNTTPGCEVGQSESILEVLPYDEVDISRCAIGWEAKVVAGAAYPFAGMGVRMRDNDLSDATSIVLETRSTGAPVNLRAELVMRSQEFMQCGDERAAHFGAAIKCDGTGAWKRQTLDLTRLNATWGKPAPLDLHDITALHFQSTGAFTGTIDCDIRLVEVVMAPLR